jgi:hypothetical protein
MCPHAPLTPSPASAGLTCEELPALRAGTVFPLLREAIPGLDLQAWLRFARRISPAPRGGVRRPGPQRAGQSGIMIARRAPRPMPCGLFIWRRDEDLAHGAVLVAEHLVAVDLLDPEPVRAALVQELDALAQRLGCGGIRTMVIRADAPIAARLLAAGHASDGTAMFKALEPAAKPAR